MAKKIKKPGKSPEVIPAEKNREAKFPLDEKGEAAVADNDHEQIPPPEEELETTPPYEPPPPAEGP